MLHGKSVSDSLFERDKIDGCATERSRLKKLTYVSKHFALNGSLLLYRCSRSNLLSCPPSTCYLWPCKFLVLILECRSGLHPWK